MCFEGWRRNDLIRNGVYHEAINSSQPTWSALTDAAQKAGYQQKTEGFYMQDNNREMPKVDADLLDKLRNYCAYQERCHKDVKDKLRSMGMISQARPPARYTDFQLKTDEILACYFLGACAYAQTS